jgi:hypothetical protein
MVKCGVLFEVRTEFSNGIQTKLRFQRGQKLTHSVILVALTVSNVRSKLQSSERKTTYLWKDFFLRVKWKIHDLKTSQRNAIMKKQTNPCLYVAMQLQSGNLILLEFPHKGMYELQACLKAASERVELRTYDEFHPTPTSQLAYQSLLCTDTTRSVLWLILNSVYIDRM